MANKPGVSMSMERRFDPNRYRDNPHAIAKYLTEAFEKNDLDGIRDAIKSIMKAQNVKALSEAIGIRRDGLYKTFGGTGGLRDPRLSRLLRLFEGLEVRITIEALPAQKRQKWPPRPKLGRPPKGGPMD
jgi:probable addiction module antidote protein